MYLLTILILSLCLACGIFVSWRFAQHVRPDRGNTVFLPMFQAKLRSDSSGRASQPKLGKTIKLLTKPQRQPRSGKRQRLLLVIGIVLVVVGVGGVFIYNNIRLRALIQMEAPTEIAVQLPLSGDSAKSGIPPSEGITLAIEEANANGQGPLLTFTTYDDQGSVEIARELANQIVASAATLVLGPALSTTSIATGPIYAKADLLSLPTNATSDLITTNATTFRVLFKNSDEGELLANYLVRVLGQKQAAVFVVDSTYGQTLRDGFEPTATALGINATYYVFKDATQISDLARQVAEINPHPPVVLLTLDREGAQVLMALRRLGVVGPFLGGDSLGKESFPELVKTQPEEQKEPGFFTNNLYAVAPMILDSANADILAFAERYRARFGHNPDWSAVSGYDAATLAIAAIRMTASDPAIRSNLSVRREAIVTTLRSLNSPEHGLPGLLGTFWFDQNQGRQQAIRMGHFSAGRFESAPIQIVTIVTPDPAEVSSGAAFELTSGRYARLQIVAHTGVFLNQIAQVDVNRSSVMADFYLWMRYPRITIPGGRDPTKLRFPDLVNDSFASIQPLVQQLLEDGTEYRLWRMRGEFRQAFDLRRFPFDRQKLSFSFFNVDATADKIVYVVDQQNPVQNIDGSVSSAGATAPTAVLAGTPGIAATEAFDLLNQWNVLSAQAKRASLRTDATLGNPAQGNSKTQIELSTFVVAIELERRVLVPFANTLLPLLILSLLMFGSLFFPASRGREKVIIALIAALCGIVPLSMLTSQLGSIGYAIPIGNIFYVYFGLALLCIITVLITERLRQSGAGVRAAQMDMRIRMIFLIIVIATVVVMMFILWQ